jgi:hypothetical protein
MTKRFTVLNQRGSLLGAALIAIIALSIIGLSLTTYVSTRYVSTNRSVYTANALLSAEAGLEQTLYQLNQNDNFAGYTTEQTFFNKAEQGRGVFTTTITNSADTNAKIITSIGTTYNYNKTTNPISTRTLKVTVVGTTSGGYSVYTGPGGLILGGSANITNSDVYVNGKITMTGAARIGTHSQPLNVNVANLACPTGTNPGPTYPQLCTTTEPISLTNSTFIYGSVCATGQTSTGPNPSGNIQGGSTGQGLIVGCTAPVVSSPTYDRNAHIAAVTTTGAGNSNTYVCNNWPFTRNWPANLRLTGNVSIGSSCDVTINGNVHITGDFTLNGAAKLRISNTLGTTQPVIIVDGKVTVGGSAQIIANSSGTGAKFISFKSSAACTPSCSSVTGTDLKNSQALETASISGAVNLPGSIFQAYWGKITVTGSGNIGAAAGQTVDLSGAGTITFGTILSSGNRSWTISSYQRQY